MGRHAAGTLLQFWNFNLTPPLPIGRSFNSLGMNECFFRHHCASAGLSAVTLLAKFGSSPFCIACVALLLRFWFLHDYIRTKLVAVDGLFKSRYETFNIAVSIATGHGFASPLGVPTGPTAWITPVYPYIMAGIFKVFGLYSFSSNVAVRVADILFSVATCIVIQRLGAKVFSPDVGTIAAWLWALLPYSIYYSVYWLWDTSLSALIVAISLLATYSIGDRREGRPWALFGLLWAFSALVNAAVISIFPGCLIFAAYRAKEKGFSWRKLSLISTMFFIAALSPWIIRNEIVFHGKVAVRSNFGLELWLGNNPQVPTSWTPWLHPNEDPQEREKFVSMGEVPYMQEKQRLALDFMRSHPSETLVFQLHRVMETWTGNQDTFRDIFLVPNFYVRANLIFNYSLLLLAFGGLLLACRGIKTLAVPLLNAILIFPLVYYICHTSPRYRHPIDPVMAILCAYSLTNIAGWFKKRANREPGVLPDAANSAI